MTTYLFWCMLENLYEIRVNTITWDIISEMDKQINDKQFAIIDSMLKE